MRDDMRVEMCGNDLREVMAETAIDHCRGSFAEEGFTSGVLRKVVTLWKGKSSLPTDGVSHHVLQINPDKTNKPYFKK